MASASWLNNIVFASIPESIPKSEFDEKVATDDVLAEFSYVEEIEQWCQRTLTTYTREEARRLAALDLEFDRIHHERREFRRIAREGLHETDIEDLDRKVTRDWKYLDQTGPFIRNWISGGVAGCCPTTDFEERARARKFRRWNLLKRLEWVREEARNYRRDYERGTAATRKNGKDQMLRQ